MCGIVGYTGNKNSIKVLIKGLKNLEYRGYDSSGIAFIEKDKIKILKQEGKIKNLEKLITDDDNSNIGIGHTRWATHGQASKTNAHPHRVGHTTLVHNGIIENYIKLKEELIKQGYAFKTDTDTEVACALIDSLYKETKNKLLTLKKANEKIIGSYAFVIIFDDDKENIYVMRKDSPLIIALGEGENFIASDVPAILEFTNKYQLLEKDEYGVINKNKVIIYNNDLKEIKKEIKTYEESLEAAQKNGYEHFMLKEINDEPTTLTATYEQFFKQNINELLKNMPDFSKYKDIDIIGCGSAYHAGLVGKKLIETYADIKVNTYLASEYRYEKNFSTKDTLTILISQSGETADTLAALRKAKERGIDTLGIINTVGSSIAREASQVFYIKVGCEISVATTKAYQAQVLILELLALSLAVRKNKITKDEANKILQSIKQIPQEITKEIQNKQTYDNIAKKIYTKEDIFFLGRGIDYSLCMEASLKLKEISYIHSEAYAAGELKHGTISLIEQNTPVIGLVTDKNLAMKTISNIKETKARGSFVVLVTLDSIYEDYKNDDFYDEIITLKDLNDFTSPLLAMTIFQLLSYEVAYLKGEEIDKPRNLAKSVTVE